MKLDIRKKMQFQHPTELRDDAPFLGATVGEWDKALTGNMQQTLHDLKSRLTSAITEPPIMIPSGLNRDQLIAFIISKSE